MTSLWIENNELRGWMNEIKYLFALYLQFVSVVIMICSPNLLIRGREPPPPWMIDLCHNLSFSHYQLCHTENAKCVLRAKALESCIQTFRWSQRDIGCFTWMKLELGLKLEHVKVGLLKSTWPNGFTLTWLKDLRKALGSLLANSILRLFAFFHFHLYCIFSGVIRDRSFVTNTSVQGFDEANN